VNFKPPVVLVLDQEQTLIISRKRPERTQEKHPPAVSQQDDAEMDAQIEDQTESNVHANGNPQSDESRPQKQSTAPSAAALGSSMAQTLTANSMSCETLF
jgi:hypothetical protein